MEKYLIQLQTNLVKYSVQLQTNLTTPSSVSNATEDRTNIQAKLNNMKQFANRVFNEVHKTSKQEVATIKESAGSIFL